MIIKLLRDHLPWVAPTVAIVFAASGYFDRSMGSDTAATAPVAETLNTNAATLAQNTTALTSTGTSIAPAGDAEVVTRLSTVTNSSLEMLQPEQVAAPEVVAAVQPVPVAPVTPVVETQTASLQQTESANAFFADAQANLSAHESCVNDLRSLSEQSQVM